MAFKSIIFLNILLLLSFFTSGFGSLGIPCGLGPGGFGYNVNAPNGPPNWSQLSPAFKKCNNGKMQSPINIPSSVKKDSKSKNPILKFKKTELKFECTNFNWELLCEDIGTCGTTKFAGKTWNVVNQHFHAPSEHTLQGKRFALEAHTVHSNSAGDTLVIATFFKEGGKNSEFENILKNIEEGEEEFKVNLKKLIKSKKGFCTYQGSLTTPPCTEGVTWLINPKIQTVSKSQIKRFEATTGSAQFGNARPIQPLNDRVVTCFVK